MEDELAPEVDDPLQEVHPTSLPKCKPPKAKAPCDQCEMVCKTTFLLNRHKKARHGNTETEVTHCSVTELNHCLIKEGFFCLRFGL